MENKKIARYSLLILATISITYFIENFLRTAASALTPVLMEELKLSHGTIGLVISAYFFIYGLMQLPSGILGDILGSENTIISFTSITILGVFLFWISKSLNLLMLAQFLIGVGSSVFYINAIRIISLWFSPERRATAVGILSAFTGMGNFVSYMGFPNVVEIWGNWRPFYLYMMIIFAINWFMNIVILRKRQNPPFKAKNRERPNLKKILI